MKQGRSRSRNRKRRKLPLHTNIYSAEIKRKKDQVMESPEYAPVLPHSDASRPSLGFPLGTALLLIVIFTLSGVFSCCYHWDKLRTLRQSSSDDNAAADADLEAASSKPLSLSKEEQGQSLPVLMPGDDIPRFLAMPCPREPPRVENRVVPPLQKPPKPPRFPVPLY